MKAEGFVEIAIDGRALVLSLQSLFLFINIFLTGFYKFFQKISHIIEGISTLSYTCPLFVSPYSYFSSGKSATHSPAGLFSN